MVPLDCCPLDHCPVDLFLQEEVEGPLDCWILLPSRYSYLLSPIWWGEGEVAPAEYQGKDFVQEEVEERPNEHYPHCHCCPGVREEVVMRWAWFLMEEEEHCSCKAK